MDAASYVLKRFPAAERESMDVTIQEAADAVVLWAKEGVQKAMNAVNASTGCTSEKGSSPAWPREVEKNRSNDRNPG